MRVAPLVLILALGACSGSSGSIPDALAPDVVYMNGHVVTLDARNSVVTAIAIKGDRIVAVGNDEELRALTGRSTVVYDLEGRTIIPGLQDSHLHFIGLGADDYYVARFDDATSIAEIQDLLRAHMTRLEADNALDVWTHPSTGEEGPWLFGAGWNQAKLSDGRMATRQEL
ncbi:MAG: amidohydrolase family protein, partial [Gemmatimonadota bacterium]|nr:amidohydrolase family protein [Gemmatimonadota bacterium]